MICKTLCVSITLQKIVYNFNKLFMDNMRNNYQPPYASVPMKFLSPTAHPYLHIIIMSIPIFSLCASTPQSAFITYSIRIKRDWVAIAYSISIPGVMCRPAITCPLLPSIYYLYYWLSPLLTRAANMCFTIVSNDNGIYTDGIGNENNNGVTCMKINRNLTRHLMLSSNLHPISSQEEAWSCLCLVELSLVHQTKEVQSIHWCPISQHAADFHTTIDFKFSRDCLTRRRSSQQGHSIWKANKYCRMSKVMKDFIG